MKELNYEESQNFYQRKHTVAGHSEKIIFFKDLIDTNLKKAGVISSIENYPVKYIEFIFGGAKVKSEKKKVREFIKKVKIEFYVEDEPELLFDIYKYPSSIYKRSSEPSEFLIFEIPINKYIKAGSHFNVKLHIGESFPVDMHLKALLVHGAIKSNLCHCKITTLMLSGCRCGGL